MAAEKTYIGERTPLGLRVLVDDGETRALLEHHVRHSPTGFECGYAGSGPSDLARCILIDHLDLHRAVRADPEALLGVDYQAFKFAVIAGLPRDEHWELPAASVQKWIDNTQGETPDGQ